MAFYTRFPTRANVLKNADMCVLEDTKKTTKKKGRKMNRECSSQAILTKMRSNPTIMPQTRTVIKNIMKDTIIRANVFIW